MINSSVSLKWGWTLATADCDRISDHSPPPVGEEFQNLIRKIRDSGEFPEIRESNREKLFSLSLSSGRQFMMAKQFVSMQTLCGWLCSEDIEFQWNSCQLMRISWSRSLEYSAHLLMWWHLFIPIIFFLLLRAEEREPERGRERQREREREKERASERSLWIGWAEFESSWKMAKW